MWMTFAKNIIIHVFAYTVQYLPEIKSLERIFFESLSSKYNFMFSSKNSGKEKCILLIPCNFLKTKFVSFLCS